jgi:hypothetical protein
MGRSALIFGTLLLGGAILAGDAVDAKEAKPAPAAAKKTVCVISEATQRFNLQKIGVMVFGNEFNSVTITGWKLDDRIYGKTKAILAKDYVVKNIPTSYEAFQPLRQPGGLFRDSLGELKAVVQKIASSAACDFVLVVMENASQFGSTNQYVGGLGVLETGSDLFGHFRQIHALTFFYVYDGKNFEILQYQRGETDESTLFKPIHGPSQEVDEKLHPSLQAVADDPKTREIVWRLLERSLELTLPKLFDTRELKEVAKIQAETRKATEKKNWAPF